MEHRVLSFVTDKSFKQALVWPKQSYLSQVFNPIQILPLRKQISIWNFQKPSLKMKNKKSFYIFVFVI